MTEIKYVAAGFLEDAEKLLDDFIQENSTKFSVLANVWKQRNFSLIFMGRGSEEELREFTQEIFNLSTQLLASGSSIRQVGVVYLLYGLFRNQILSPPVRIRVVLDHVKLIRALRDKLPFDEHKTFHYVFNYMTENCFDFVACPKLMGPTVPSLVTDIYQGTAENSILKFHTGLKSDMAEMAENKVLQETGDLFAKYVDMKSSLNLNVPGIGSDTVELFKNYSSRLSSLLDRSKTTLPVLVRNEPPTSNIGLRRVHLKAKAFGEPILPTIQTDQSFATSNDDEFSLDDAIEKPLPLRKRFPKPRRNVGRPKKEDKDNDDVSLNVSRRRRRPRKPRQRTCTSMRHYYSESEDLKLLSSYENRIIENNESVRLFTDSDVDSETAVAASVVKDTDYDDSETAVAANVFKDTDNDDSEPAITSCLVKDSDCDDPEPASQAQNGANRIMDIKNETESTTQADDGGYDDSKPAVISCFVEDSDCDDPEPASQAQNGANHVMDIKNEPESVTQADDGAIYF